MDTTKAVLIMALVYVAATVTVWIVARFIVMVDERGDAIK